MCEREREREREERERACTYVCVIINHVYIYMFTRQWCYVHVTDGVHAAGIMINQFWVNFKGIFFSCFG